MKHRWKKQNPAPQIPCLILGESFWKQQAERATVAQACRVASPGILSSQSQGAAPWQLEYHTASPDERTPTALPFSFKMPLVRNFLAIPLPFHLALTCDFIIIFSFPLYKKILSGIVVTSTFAE